MSKLSERMRRAARTEARPVGFTTVATVPQPTMLVIADLSVKDAVGAADSAAGGADALLVPDEVAEAVLQATAGGATPVGVRLPRGNRARVAALREAGADFIVLGEDSAASALMEDGLTYILDVAGEPTDTDLRALDALPVESLLVPAVEGALTIRRSIGLRRFVAFARKPLMLPVSADAESADLEALRELNVLLLLTPASGVSSLRERVAALPPRRRRREESTVGVPMTIIGRPRAEEPDEGDEGHEHE
jgi:hypothetical protein